MMLFFKRTFTYILVFAVTNLVTGMPNTTTESILTTQTFVSVVLKKSPFDYLSEEDAHLDLISQILIITDTYCRRGCSVESNVREKSPNNMCSLCYCDSQCYMYGDCCLDKYVSENRTRASTLNAECVSHTSKSLTKPFYYMVRSCSQPPVDVKLEISCLSNSTSSALTAIPVTDLDTNITYRNKYCAECNGVSTYKLWKMYVEYNNYSVFATAKDRLQIYQRAMESPDCDIAVKPEGIAGYRICSHHSESPIDKCNMTGRWWYHDEKVKTACSRFFEPVNRGDYKNIFCYVCNTDNTWSWLMMQTLGKDPSGLPLTALLDFDDSDIPKMESQQQCPNEHFFDSYNSICRQILCPLGKVFRDEKCKSLIADFIYGYYIICMDVTMQIPLSKAHKITQYIFQAIGELKRDIISRFNLTYAIVQALAVHTECSNNTVTVDYKMQLKVYSSNALRDDLEKTLSDYFRINLFSEVYFIDNQTVEFSINENTCSTWYSASILNLAMCEGRLMLFGSKVEGQRYVKGRYADLMVNDMLWCAQVELNSTEYSVEDNTSIIVIEATNRTLTSSEYQLTDSGTVKVCLFDFQRNQTVLPPNISSTINGLLSMICTSVSLAFLIISVLVYIIIPYLRTDVSRNNICLASNLIAAQTLYEFGAELIQLPLICQIIGILVHYFWLSSVFWMNACTVNLFYKICFPFHSRAQSDVKVFSFLCLYSFISPGVIVIITALSNYFVSGFSGYGHGICYLSNASSRVYGFAVPVGILVSANIVLFIYTIITICRLPKLKSTSDNKVSMIMCVNLSTITGAAWIFGYAYEATGFIGFAYAFSVFLGSIGLFLFMSFFANKFKGNLRENVLCTYCTKSVTGEVPLPANNTAVTSPSGSSDLTKQSKDISTNLPLPDERQP